VEGDVILSQKGTTQGDPLAMAMYGLATIPLIRKLDGLCLQMWHADDSAAASKTWLVTKAGYLEEASAIFAISGLNSTLNGRPYLGAVFGSQEFTVEYIKSKVSV
jgi:hypothetical protein